MSLSMLIVVMAAATMGSAVHAFTTPLAPRRTPAAVARRAAAPDDPPPATTDALFPVDDDDLDDIDYNFVEIVDDDDDEGLTAAAGGLYEIDYEDDALFSAADDVVTATTTDDDGPADTVDRLEEREDRLYVDEFGIRRKVERCILVGVENLSQRRKEVRRHPEVTDGLADATAADSISSIISSNSLSPPSPPPLHDTDVYFTLEESMAEMRELVKTAGMEIVGTITQRMNQVNPKTYVGSGKVIEALELLTERDACTVVFDAELSPGQQKSLENAFNKKLLQNDFLVSEGEIKVLDRTALILDIFAQHAKTREGKLQVDLALHEFRKPRLTKMWTHLERQSGAGGVGLRGPGESQLEIDKRLLRDRIITLKQKIDDVQKHRTMHRRGRERLGLPILSLVGYTNAGKSSLLNYLTKAGVMADSMLFATLDPTTRKVKLPGYRTHPEVLLTDTVGFIQKLPTHLVAAFRATLEEVKEADVLIHVIDVSNPTWEKQERAVISVLTDMGAADKPIVRVLNKIDLLDPLVAERLKVETSTMAALTVAVSALNGDGLMDFVAVVEEALVDLLVPIEVEIPYSKGDELNAVHEQGNVEVVDYRAEGTYVQALVPTAVAERLSKYSVNPEPSTAQGRSGIDDGIDWVSIGRGRHKTPKE
jgi:GTP-binding protein HflX